MTNILLPYRITLTYSRFLSPSSLYSIYLSRYAQLARTGVPSVRTIAPPAPTGTPGQPNGPNPVQATVTTAGSGLQTVVNVSLPPHPTYGTPSPLKSNERKLTKAEKVKSKAADWSRHNIVDKDTLRVIHAHTGEDWLLLLLLSLYMSR